MHAALQMVLLLIVGLLSQIPIKVSRNLVVPRVWQTGDIILFRVTGDKTRLPKQLLLYRDFVRIIFEPA